MPVYPYYLSVNAEPADGTVWLSRVKPTADTIATMEKAQALTLTQAMPSNVPAFVFYAVLEPSSGANAFSLSSGDILSVENIDGRKVAQIRVNPPAYRTPSQAQNNPVTVTSANA